MEMNRKILLERWSRAQIMVAEARHSKGRVREEERQGRSFEDVSWWLKEARADQEVPFTAD